MAELRTSAARKVNTNAALTASKSNVVQQARLLDSAGTAWHAVKYGNLEMITKLFPSQCNVYSKGPVGDNVFHIAMLLNTPSTLAIAKYLVKLYGTTLVNTPYQERKTDSDPPGQYEGETALHIAIVNRDFDMVKFLVQNGADVRARAYGSFFQPGGAVYYGEYPLSFAACTGQKDIVSYLKRHGARVNQDRDMWGNTALHMCVYHDQPDMYDHLVEYCGGSEHVRNNRSQTPLLLAASLGKLEAFQHVYNKRRKVAWAYGPVTSYSLSLREIDTIQNVGEFVPSAIETLVRKGHLEAVADPLVQTLLTNKWRRFARAHLVGEALLYMALVVIQTFLVWLHCDEVQWNKRPRMALEIVCVVLALLFILMELTDIWQWTKMVYKRRVLMMTATKYRPALYPIPGEKLEPADKKTSGFLSRMMAPRPVAEGGEQQQQHDPATAAPHSVIAIPPIPPQHSSRAPAPGSYSHTDLTWHMAVAHERGGPAAAGPIAEAIEPGPGPSGGSGSSHGGAASPQQQAAAAAQADSGMVRMQHLHNQLSGSKSAAQLSHMGRSSSGHGPLLPTSPSQINLSDPVSVGMASFRASTTPFSATGAQHVAMTSMLSHPAAEPSGNSHGGAPGARPGGLPNTNSLQRAPSIGQEIKNRMRGGGGGDAAPGAVTLKRSDTRKVEGAHPAEPEIPEQEEESMALVSAGLSG